MSTPPPVWPPQPGQPSPYGAPQPGAGNGTLILVLGILSIVCLPILGPVAWILGNNALKSGYVDPSQVGMINGGRICGIIGSVFIVLGLIYWIFIFAVAGTAALHPTPHSTFQSSPAAPPTPDTTPTTTTGQ